jgi:hypothetical protein
MKDEKGKILQWSKSELDDFGNTITVEGAIKSGKPTYKNTIEREYYEE